MGLNPEIIRRIKANADLQQAFRNFRAAASIAQPRIHEMAKELSNNDPIFGDVLEIFTKFWVYELLFETHCQCGKVIPQRDYYDNRMPYVLLRAADLVIKQSPVRLLGSFPRENSIVQDFAASNDSLFEGIEINERKIYLVLTHGFRADGTWGFYLGVPAPHETWVEEPIDLGKLIDGKAEAVTVQTEIPIQEPVRPKIKNNVKKEKQRKEKWQEEQQHSKAAS